MLMISAYPDESISKMNEFIEILRDSGCKNRFEN